jgi:DNA-3-methyladenine glycosylase
LPRQRRRTPTGNATPPAWRSAFQPPEEALLPLEFLARPVDVVARELLGARLVSTVGGVLTTGVIVETEAYRGLDDPASHAATRIGRTARNAAMFGPPGRAYVYRIYGMHWCMNIVTGGEGDPQAVLIRALDPLVGEEEMARRRAGATGLASGPGRLCQALGITNALYGHDLSRPPLEIRAGWRVPDAEVGVSGRIGVRAAHDWPLRFFVRDNPSVSR